MEITGTITETLVVEKDVTVDVRDDASQDEIEQAIRAKAYEKLVSTETGWEILETLNVDIKFPQSV